MVENSNINNTPDQRSSGLFLNMGYKNFILIGGGNREKAFSDIWQLNLNSSDNQNKTLDFLQKKWEKFTFTNNEMEILKPRFGHTGIVHKAKLDNSLNLYIHGGQNHFSGSFYSDFFLVKFKEEDELNKSQENVFRIKNFGKNSNNSIYSKNFIFSEIKNLIKYPIDIINTPCERNSHTLSFDNKNSLYIFGGGNGSGLLNDLWEFNIEKEKFSQILFEKNKIKPREMHGMVYYKDHLYIFGGRLYESIDNKIYKINLINLNVETDFTTLPCPLCSFSYVLYKNYIIIFGGTDGINFLNNIFIYNLNNNKWAKSKINLFDKDKENGLEGRIGSHMAIDEETDTLVIFGGSGIHQDSNEIFMVYIQELLNENNLIQVSNANIN